MHFKIILPEVCLKIWGWDKTSYLESSLHGTRKYQVVFTTTLLSRNSALTPCLLRGWTFSSYDACFNVLRFFHTLGGSALMSSAYVHTKREFFEGRGRSKGARPQKRKVKDILAQKWVKPKSHQVLKMKLVHTHLCRHMCGCSWMAWAWQRTEHTFWKELGFLAREVSTDQYILSQKKSGSEEKSGDECNINNYHFLRSCHMPGTALGTRDLVVNETRKTLFLPSLSQRWR